jgi:hypothetical protein
VNICPCGVYQSREVPPSESLPRLSTVFSHILCLLSRVFFLSHTLCLHFVLFSATPCVCAHRVVLPSVFLPGRPTSYYDTGGACAHRLFFVVLPPHLVSALPCSCSSHTRCLHFVFFCSSATPWSCCDSYTASWQPKGFTPEGTTEWLCRPPVPFYRYSPILHKTVLCSIAVEE